MFHIFLQPHYFEIHFNVGEFYEASAKFFYETSDQELKIAWKIEKWGTMENLTLYNCFSNQHPHTCRKKMKQNNAGISNLPADSSHIKAFITSGQFTICESQMLA